MAEVLCTDRGAKSRIDVFDFPFSHSNQVNTQDSVVEVSAAMVSAWNLIPFLVPGSVPVGSLKGSLLGRVRYQSTWACTKVAPHLPLRIAQRQTPTRVPKYRSP